MDDHYRIVRHVEASDAKSTDLSEQEIEALVRQEGYEGFLWNDPPGSKYPRHRHNVDELIWVISGQIWFKFGDEVISLIAGDRIYLPKKIAHEATASQSMGAKYFVGQKTA